MVVEQQLGSVSGLLETSFACGNTVTFPVRTRVVYLCVSAKANGKWPGNLKIVMPIRCLEDADSCVTMEEMKRTLL
ncbi:hypothetical protein GRJ2_001144600 [Grus japonensis]|uniref:Uncharacterized protein n=1 Tax=Grus japonensis TaxID=30415 RepID=A0ABC9WMW3_GRUJA